MRIICSITITDKVTMMFPRVVFHASGEQTQEMIGNIVVLMKDQLASSLKDFQIPDKNTTERGLSFLYHKSQYDMNESISKREMHQDDRV